MENIREMLNVTPQKIINDFDTRIIFENSFTRYNVKKNLNNYEIYVASYEMEGENIIFIDWVLMWQSKDENATLKLLVEISEA